MKNKNEIKKGEIIEGSIMKELDNRFLNSRFFMGEGTLGLTIDRVEKIKDMEYNNGKKKEKVIMCYFTNTEKPLELCKTNVNRIIDITKTTKPKEWTGWTIGFHTVKELCFGEMKNAVRVDVNYKSKAPAAKKV